MTDAPISTKELEGLTEEQLTSKHHLAILSGLREGGPAVLVPYLRDKAIKEAPDGKTLALLWEAATFVQRVVLENHETTLRQVLDAVKATWPDPPSLAQLKDGRIVATHGRLLGEGVATGKADELIADALSAPGDALDTFVVRRARAREEKRGKAEPKDSSRKDRLQ